MNLHTIREELRNMWSLIKTHCIPFSILSFSTLLIVLFKEKKNPILPTPQINGLYDQDISRLIYWGIVPLIFGILVAKKTPKQLGLGLGNVRYWLPVSAVFIILTLPLVYASSSMIDIQHYYGRRNFHFDRYLLQTSITMLGWEFFFRGFMTLGLKDSLKESSILIQMIPFTLLHLGKPLIESISCIPAGLFWGYVCYKSDSFWPAFFMHLALNLVLKCGSVGYF
jgi:uncharacterized protein